MRTRVPPVVTRSFQTNGRTKQDASNKAALIELIVSNDHQKGFPQTIQLLVANCSVLEGLNQLRISSHWGRGETLTFRTASARTGIITAKKINAHAARPVATRCF